MLNINVGDTVTWTNADTVGHTATSGKPTDNVTGTVWDSGLIKAGGTYVSPPFNSAGTYNYFDEIHPWMTGQIIVGGGGTATVPEFGSITGIVIVLSLFGSLIISKRFSVFNWH